MAGLPRWPEGNSPTHTYTHTRTHTHVYTNTHTYTYTHMHTRHHQWATKWQQKVHCRLKHLGHTPYDTDPSRPTPARALCFKHVFKFVHREVTASSKLVITTSGRGGEGEERGEEAGKLSNTRRGAANGASSTLYNDRSRQQLSCECRVIQHRGLRVVLWPFQFSNNRGVEGNGRERKDGRGECQDRMPCRSASP